MEEKFVDIHGYEGLYKVGNLGSIWNVKRQRFSKAEIRKDGPTRVVLRKNKKNKEFRLHVLIAKHFIPNPAMYFFVRVKNGDYSDMRVENLEWMSHSTAAQEKIKPLESEYMRQGRLTVDDVKAIRKLFDTEGLGQMELAEMFGVTKASIWHIVNRTTWKDV